MPAGMQLCWIWLLLLSPASDRALSSHPRLRQKGLSPSAGGAGEKSFLPAAVKMSFVWVQKASTGYLQPEDPKRSVFVQNEWFHRSPMALLPVL